ncbi:sterol 26-hydroxylase, mitochondrial-like [Rana temporaria]|uniref:sterol 26-hydroxylase, mitochondrial-like n=1 Tax=Rana temporaria TaxID=8407 RepID=UPI001AAD9D5C|nr:sterol 26-hydroxylase, mitochondrial-like [Rana temporaria]
MISPSLRRWVLALWPRAVLLQPCRVGGTQHRAVSGVGGTQHRAVSGVGGTQHRAVNGVGGTQHRAVSGVGGTQHRAVSGVGGTQHRAVSGVGGTQHRAVSGVGGTQHRAVSGVGGTQHRAVSGAATTAITEDKNLKTYDDLPGPSLLTNLYWFFIRGYLLYSHELQLVYVKRYGPWWKATIGNYKMVCITDPAILEKVVRLEGKYPLRNEYDLWRTHRELRNLAYGPFTEQGNKWHALRTILNKKMLKPAEAKSYAGSINDIVSDFVARLQDLRKESPTGEMVNDVANEFYRFALEGVSYIVFETRIGCLDKQIPAETQGFITSIGEMLKNSVYATYLPQWSRGILPYWKKYLDGWDRIFNFGKKLIDKKMSEIQARLERGEEVQGEYLTYLLSSGKLTMSEVYGSVSELLLAGVDTTSNTLTWSLYHLAKDPQLQETLHQEVIKAVPLDRIPTADDITHMPLLRAVIKETLRMYPVVPTNARIITDKEVIIKGFKFPKRTLFVLNHYAISRDEAQFPEPGKFCAQRWLRDEGMTHHPFGSIPFGYGVRACAGKRIAELEMHLALSRIIRMFEVKPDPNLGDVKTIARIVLSANRPINLRFLERKTA